LTKGKTKVDTIISGAKIVSMDSDRRVFMDGALAVSGQLITAIGTSADIDERFEATEDIDGSRFVITPGLINAHVHITGDPLTRAWLPDNIDADFEEELTRWVLPRFYSHSPDDEAVSAELAALKMLRTGTTCFLEAGTVQYLDRVVEGAGRTGIRGRVGSWVEGRDFSKGADQAKSVDEAIGKLEDEVARFPATNGEKIAAWPILVGHSTNPDEVWKAAKKIADDLKLGVSAHMSPYDSDPAWYLEQYQRRPIEHLADIGVLGRNLCLTHLAHIDESEQALLAESGTNAVLCPLASLRGVFGLAAVGRFPEMAGAGINIMLGSDGFDHDMMRQTQIVSSLFKDVRQDAQVFPAEQTLEMLTRNGALGLGLEHEIGSLEAGKKADFVCHDTDRPEWQPLQGIVNQLAWLADGRSVHSVWVDGLRVIENYRSTMIDEESLYQRAEQSSQEIFHRTGLPFVSPWPVE
jgi:cytosine/adenosine deaminase-related metal-dependent hydrolase